MAPDSILPATHLTLFLPPRLGAFVLANHQSHEEFKSQATPTFSVQQHLQFPLPQVFSNQSELLSLARQSAADGYLSSETIPFLGHSNFKKVRWALRFSTPPSIQRSCCTSIFLHSCFSPRAAQWRGARGCNSGCSPIELRKCFCLPARFTLSQTL